MSSIIETDKTCLLKLLWTKSQQTANHAYVYSVFGNSQYLLAAIASAWSLKQVETRADIVLLATDISDEMIEWGKYVFDKIYSAPYLKICCKSLRTEKQRKRYESWMNISCTKWNCLNLTEYEKIIYLDADTIVLQNIDNLFQLSTPAGTFSSPQAQGYCVKGGMYNPYLSLREGDLVPMKMIEEGLSGKNGCSFTVIGTSVVLSPNAKHYSELLNMLANYSEKNSFGYVTCNSGIDEQVLVELYSKFLPAKLKQNFQWTYVSQKSGFIPWHGEWLRKEEWPPTVLHYFGQKFWTMKREEWLDLEPLWITIQSLINHIPENEREKLSQLYRFADKTVSNCFYCKLMNADWKSHPFMKESGIVCPLYVGKSKLCQM